MAKLDKHRLAVVLAGYHAGPEAPNPHLYSSSSFEAFEVGRYCCSNSQDPNTVEKGRGSLWRCERETLDAHYGQRGAFRLLVRHGASA